MNIEFGENYNIIHDGLIIEENAKIIKLEDAKLYFESQDGKNKYIMENDVERCDFIKVA